MKLLVVIVSYRVTDLTIDCLRSLAGEIGRVPGTRVAVCENGTGGDAEERLRRPSPRTAGTRGSTSRPSTPTGDSPGATTP